jgi:hypothetical protein
MPVSEFETLVCVVALFAARIAYLLRGALSFGQFMSVTILIVLILLAALPWMFSRPRAVTHALLSLTMLTILLFCTSPSSNIIIYEPTVPPSDANQLLYRPEWWDGDWSGWEDDAVKPRQLRRRLVLCWNFTDTVADALCDIEQRERGGRKRPEEVDFREIRFVAPISGS